MRSAIMRKWLQTLVDQFLPAVELLQDTPEGRAQGLKWATWMRQQWVEHGLVELKQQRNLMTDVRNAIKSQLGEDHLALDCLNFTVAEWTAINSPIEQQVARRNEHVVLLENPDAIVALAVRLLESREWAEVAAGLVVLTGRRSSEILGTAQFQPKSQWSVMFTGALKRRGEVQRLSFEIPTLTTAERVIKALEKLRQICPTQGLSAGQINQKYAQAVATACDLHFSELVPKREGRDNLFSHLFRSVYSAISTLWYAPPNVDANEYKAAIQGHYAILDADDGTLRRSLAASRHYNDYKIGDPNGNIDGRQGIKLGYGGVEVIDAFNPEKGGDAIREEGVDIDTPVNGQVQEQDKGMASTQGVSHQAIKADARVLEEADDRMIHALGDRASEKGEGAMMEQVSQHAIEAASAVLSAALTPQKQATRRVKPVSVDLDVLKAVAERLGIQVRGGRRQGYDHALLEILLRLQQGEIKLGEADPSEEPVVSVSQTVADQAKTLAWLTTRIEGLEKELVQVRREKEDAVQNRESQGMELLEQEVERLKAENQRLNAELQLTQSRLENIQKVLSGGESSPSVQGKKTVIPVVEPGASVTPRTVALSPSPQTPEPPQTDLDPDALRALQAILDFNDQTAITHSEKWAISIPVMKELLKQVGKATQPKIEAVLREMRDTIEHHHRLHGLGERHNRVHKGRSVSEKIRL